MKRIKVLFFALASLLLASCDDAIDIRQPSELYPEDTFITVADLDLGLNGIYGAVPGETEIYFTSYFTDEIAIGRANGGQGTGGELAFLLNSNVGEVASIWSSYYYLINAANRVIAGAENVIVEEGSDDEATKNDILAEAHALRAYGHLKLMSYFCPDMADDSALGVIAVDYVPTDINVEPARNTAGEVWNLVLSDLDFFDANAIPSNVNADKSYINQYAVLAMRARIAAFRENYALANQYVDELDAVFNLTASAQYANLFKETIVPGTEVIWELERIPDPGSPTIGNFYQIYASVNSTVNGSPFFEVSRDLFNSYEDSDVRKFVVVDPSAIIEPNYQNITYQQYIQDDVLPVGKYGNTDGAQLNGDIKVFRFSEMVLIKAEYYASVSDYTNVATQVNRIRTARGASQAGVPSSSEEAWRLILEERRREFAFEGHRYIDIKRLGIKANQGIDRDSQDCSFNGACTLPPTDYRFTALPIPLAELAANNNVVQNPQYAN